MHPDAFNPAQPFKALFNAGTVAINAADGYPGWNAVHPGQLGQPGLQARADARLQARRRQAGALGVGQRGLLDHHASKKQDDPERVKLMLRMLNYLAAPFGTEEYFYRLYGEEGVDHTLDDNGNPVLTKTGHDQHGDPDPLPGRRPLRGLPAGRPQDADTQHDYQSLEIPTGIANPTVGPVLQHLRHQERHGRQDFLNERERDRPGSQAVRQPGRAGRRPGSKQAGDGMRTEYQEQLQSAGGR